MKTVKIIKFKLFKVQYFFVNVVIGYKMSTDDSNSSSEMRANVNPTIHVFPSMLTEHNITPLNAITQIHAASTNNSK